MIATATAASNSKSTLLTLTLLLVLSTALLMTTPTVSAATTADLSKYMGEWKLTELYNDQQEPVEIPSSSEGFVLHLLGKEDDVDGSNSNANSLVLYTHIGNNLRTTVEFVDDNNDDGGDDDDEDSIKIGMIASTMMMPPPEMYALEQYLSTYLPSMTSIQVSGDGEELVLMGAGRIVAVAVAKAAV